MIVLALHSTTPSLGAAVVVAGRVVCERLLPPGRKHLENVAGLIDDVMHCANTRLKEVDAFAVTTGPGSFSGIRVGLSVVKGLALALRKPAIGVSCLEALAWASLDEEEQGVPIIDARRGQVYTAFYRKKRERAVLMDGPFLMSADEAKRLIRDIDGPLILSGDRVGAEWSGSRVHTVQSSVETVTAGSCALIAHERLAAGETDDFHGPAPLYIRRSDAEEKSGMRTGVAADGARPYKP